MIDQQETPIKDIMRVFILEHWARFYHAQERDGKTWLELPEDVLEDCRAKHPDLAPLLEEANRKELTYEGSCTTVGAFVCRLYDGVKYVSGVVLKALDSRAFKIEQHMFGLWLKGHEGYLDQHALSYDDWLEMFTNWNLMDQVKAFRQKLEQTPAKDADKPTATH